MSASRPFLAGSAFGIVAGAIAALKLIAPPPPPASVGGVPGPGASGGATAASTPAPASREAESLPGTSKKELEAALERLTEERAQAALAKTELEARLAKATAERDEAKKAQAVAEAALASAGAGAAPAKRRLRVDFGGLSKVPEVAEASWGEMGEATRNINGLLADIIAASKEGKEPSHELGIAIAKENMKLQRFAFAASGKLPTHAPGNGEFTHPIALANIIAEHLRAVNLPLSEEQAARIASLGEEFVLDWERRESLMTDATTTLEKVLSELEGKRAFKARLLTALSAEQRAIIAPPGIADCFLLDVHSPGLILLGMAHAVPGASREAIEAALHTRLCTDLGVPEEKRAALAPLTRAFVEAIAPTLGEAVPAGEAPYFALDLGEASLRAMIAWKREALRSGGLDPSLAGGFAESRLVLVPRLTKA